MSSYNFIGWLPVPCHSCWFLLDPGTTSFIQSPVSLHCFQLRNFYPSSPAPCLFSLIPHSQSSWPCPFLPVYLPHSLVPICSLTPSEENLPHDPVSPSSCLAQPLKPDCLTLVLCSSHFLSSLHQKISIFYLICPTSAQPAEVITRRTPEHLDALGWCLEQHSTLGEVICFYSTILNQNVLIFGFDQIPPRLMSWKNSKSNPWPQNHLWLEVLLETQKHINRRESGKIPFTEVSKY